MSNSSVHRSLAIGPAISPDANLISYNIKRYVMLCCVEEERNNREENREERRDEESKKE
jgi:hypothetical protein